MRLAFTSFRMDSSIFPEASLADVWFGGVKNGKSWPVAGSLTMWGGIPWSKPDLKPSKTSWYFGSKPALCSASSHRGTFISQRMRVGHPNLLFSTNRESLVSPSSSCTLADCVLMSSSLLSTVDACMSGSRFGSLRVNE